MIKSFLKTYKRQDIYSNKPNVPTSVGITGAEYV